MHQELRFSDLFPELCNQAKRYKAHLAIGRREKNEPLVELSRGRFKEWQEYQNNKNFERDYIVSLVYYRPTEWIFAGVYKRIDVQKHYDSAQKKEYYRYTTELLDTRKDLIARLIFSFPKEFRQSYVYLENFYEQFSVKAILPRPYRVEPFPGYENVILSFEKLKEIILSEDASWKTALSNSKGVYLITDRKNGRHYVGSAYGEDAFWNRWQAYSDTGHGENVELIEVLEKKGTHYKEHFQFSILEIRSRITDDEEIIKREKHWKNALGTREFGYNRN